MDLAPLPQHEIPLPPFPFNRISRRRELRELSIDHVTLNDDKSAAKELDARLCRRSERPEDPEKEALAKGVSDRGKPLKDEDNGPLVLEIHLRFACQGGVRKMERTWQEDGENLAHAHTHLDRPKRPVRLDPKVDASPCGVSLRCDGREGDAI
jgi:hypothetical protein